MIYAQRYAIQGQGYRTLNIGYSYIFTVCLVLDLQSELTNEYRFK